MSSFSGEQLGTSPLAGFDVEVDIPVVQCGCTFHVYLAGVNRLKHGLALMIHGGGFTGMSWAPVASYLKSACCVVAMDLRGHGLTTAEDETDLSTATLLQDLTHLTAAVLAHPILRGADASGAGAGTCRQTSVVEPPPLEPQALPPVLLVGHSLGGALAVRLAAGGLVPGAAGLVVVDMVEGTALAMLEHMPQVLQSIPPKFESMATAVEWHLKTGAVRNKDAAWVTVPSRLRPCASAPIMTAAGVEVHTGAVQEGPDAAPRGPPPGAAAWLLGPVEWRTDLGKSAPFWRGWFEGLSRMFLETSLPRLLVVAGMDRLDTPLTVGQIQGKFQMKLVYGCGHSIQEDRPAEVAEAVATFAHRFSIFRHLGETPAMLGPAADPVLQAKLARARQLMQSLNSSDPG